MHVFLDLWGVILDEVKMNEEYNALAAEKLASRFGGEPSVWREAYDSSWENYLLGLAEAEAKGDDWLAAADRLDPPLILDTLRAVGVDWQGSDILSFARDLEGQVAASVAMAYPDAKATIEKLRMGGHKVHVATQAGDWNARAALQGSGLVDHIDSIFSGSSQRAFKSVHAYWREIPKVAQVKGARPVLVDDRLDYLKAAHSAGFIAILLVRGHKKTSSESSRFVTRTLSSLSDLPLLIESLAQEKIRRRL